MGREARRRGTYEERVEQSIKRQKEEAEAVKTYLEARKEKLDDYQKERLGSKGFTDRKLMLAAMLGSAVAITTAEAYHKSRRFTNG